MRDIKAHPRIQYIRSLFAPEDVCLKSIRENLESEEFPIQIGAEEGKLLQLIIRMCSVKNILEIGTHGAYSTIWMARALPSNGKIITLENSPSRVDRARQNITSSDVAHKIELIEADAMDSLKAIKQKFDLIFIDADKINYLNYLDWAEDHVTPGGVIIGDNTFLFENVYQEIPDKNVRIAAFEAMREFNLRLSNPQKYCSIMLPTKEGMTIALKL